MNQRSTFFEHYPKGIIITDRNHSIADINEKAKRLLNINDDVTGQSIAVLNLNEHILDNICQYSVDRQDTAVFIIKNNVGENKKLQFEVSPFRFEDDKHKMIMISVIKNNTDEELEIGNYTNEINTVMEMFRQAMASEKVGFWDYSIVEDELIFDEYKLAIYGLDKDEFDNTLENWLRMIHPDDVDKVKSKVTNSIRTGCPFFEEYRIIRKDGKIVHTATSGQMLDMVDGASTRAVGFSWDLSKQKQIDKNLRSAIKMLKRYTEVVEQSPSSVVVMDTKGMVEYVNPNFTKITGYTKEEILGRNLLPFKFKDSKGIKYDDVWATILEGHDWTGTIRTKKKSGEDMYENVYISSLVNDHDDIDGRIFISEDITEKRLSEMDKEIFQKITENSPDFIGFLDSEGEYTRYLNKAGRRLIGISEDADITEVTAREFHAEWAYKKVIEEGFPTALKEGYWIGETALVTRDGNEVPVSQAIVVVRNDVGEVNAICGIMRDLTKEKENQKENQFLLSLIERTPDFMGFIGINGNVAYVNKAGRKLLGFGEFEDLSKMTIEDFHPDWVNRELLKKGLPIARNKGIWEGESAIIRSDTNEEIPVKLVLLAPKWKGEKAPRIVGIMRDISDTKRYEKELLEAKETAEQAAKAKNDFLVNMSHEIRTPMNAVIGLNELLLNTSLNSKQKDYVIKAGQSARNLLSIINDILDSSKIESGNLTIEKINFNLKDVIENLTNITSFKALEKDIDLIISMNPNVPSGLVGDPYRLGQVLLNLTDNAIKFTEQGEVVVSVELNSKTEEEVKLKFSVQDSGIGMTKEQVSKIFKDFSQADTSITRKYGGTGLGLSISEKLIKLMNGRISVASEYGKGSVFHFILDFPYSKNALGKKRILPLSLKDLKVLIAEGNKSVGNIIKNYLLSFNLKPTLVMTGEDAVKEIEKNRYDLVITNYKLPGINGIETWKRIREALANINLPKVILIISHGLDDAVNRARREKIKHMMTKPVLPSYLYDIIIRAFSQEATFENRSIDNTGYSELFKDIAGARILVVEDNKINQLVVKDMLENEGFWIDVAENGKVAIDMVMKNDYDLVLMDLQMPVVDGYNATLAIRAEYSDTQLPIIALSADVMSGTEEKVIKVGMNGFIFKPIDKEELFALLVKWIKAGNYKRVSSLKDVGKGTKKETIIKTLMGIDVNEGLNRVSGNEDLYFRLLRDFYDEYENFSDELYKFINNKEQEKAKVLVHTLKGVAGNIGMTKLYHLCAELEETLVRDEFNEERFFDAGKRIKIEILSALKNICKLFSEVNYIENNIDKKIDKAEYIKKLEELRTAIEGYDANFQNLYKQLSGIEQGRKIEKEYKVLGEYIHNYDFEMALEACTDIIKKLQD